MKKGDIIYDIVRQMVFVISNIKMSHFIDKQGNSHYKKYCIKFDQKAYRHNLHTCSTLLSQNETSIRQIKSHNTYQWFL